VISSSAAAILAPRCDDARFSDVRIVGEAMISTIDTRNRVVDMVRVSLDAGA